MTAFSSLALTYPRGRGYDGGTSGIVAGIGGAVVVLVWRGRKDSPTARRWWRTAAVVVPLLGLVSATWAANVNQVHGVSFLAGAVMAAALRSAGPLRPSARGTAVLLVVISIAVAGFRTIEQPRPAPPDPTPASGPRDAAPQRALGALGGILLGQPSGPALSGRRR
jgi:hypothetical protein